MGGVVRTIKKTVNKTLRFTTKIVSKTLDIASFGLIKSKQRAVGLDHLARQRKHNVRASAEPQRMIFGEVNTGGVLVFADSSGTNDKYLHLVIALAGHPCDSINSVKFDEYNATDDAIKNKVRVQFFSGASNTIATDLVNASSEWTHHHRGKGICYVYARVQWDENIWKSGIPTITMNVKGMKVYDPRSRQVTFSDNPALCILAYLRHPDGGRARDSEIDWGYWRAAANSCDETLQLTPSLSDKRFRLNTEVILNASCVDILENLLTACAGTLVYSNGKYRLHVGVATTPLGRLDEDDLRAPLQLTPRPSRTDLFNAVRGTFINAEASWEPCEFGMISNNFYESQDGGERIVRHLELPCTTKEAHARLLAKITLEEARQSVMIEFPAKMSALSISVWDVVKVNIARLGYKDKLFRVISWRIDEEGGITLLLREYADAIYGWNPNALPQRALSQGSSLPTRPVLLPPHDIGVYSGKKYFLRLHDGNYIHRLFLQWNSDYKGQLRHYEINYRLKGEAWQSILIDGTQKEAFINMDSQSLAASALTEMALHYHIRMRAVTLRGRTSSWSLTTHHSLDIHLPPPKPINLRLQKVNSATTRISWETDTNNDEQALLLKGFEVYHSKEANDKNLSSPHHSKHPSIDIPSPAAGSYFFKVRAIALNGQHKDSNFVAFTIPHSPTRALDFSHSAAKSGWRGTFHNCFINRYNKLENAGTSVISDLPSSIAALPDTFSPYSSLAQEFSYETETFDLGKEMTFYTAVALKNAPVSTSPYYRTTHFVRDDKGTLHKNPLGTITTRRFSVKMNFQMKHFAPPGAKTVDDMLIALDENIVTKDHTNIDVSTDTTHLKKQLLWSPGLVTLFPPRGGYTAVVGVNITQIHNGDDWTWYYEHSSATLDGSRAPLVRILGEDGNRASGTYDVTVILLRDTAMPYW